MPNHNGRSSFVLIFDRYASHRTIRAVQFVPYCSHFVCSPKPFKGEPFCKQIANVPSNLSDFFRNEFTTGESPIADPDRVDRD